MKSTIAVLARCAFGATFVIASIGCGGTQTGDGAGTTDPGEGKAAVAAIEARSGSSTSGVATFTTDGKAVSLTVEISGAPPGEHAVHIHENPDCSSPDGESAGAHWNPTGEPHGHLGETPAHLGDIGNIKVGDDGKGSLTFTTERWTLGSGQPNDVVDHSIVVHAGPDDFVSQPSGNAGGRIGCGVIKRK